MLFSLYNTKTDVFGRLFEAPDNETAKRMFMELLSSPEQNLITKYIDEYVLFELGDFDTTTGNITVNSAPINVINGIQVVQEWKQRRKFLEELYQTSNSEDDLKTIDIPDFLKEVNKDECGK